MGRKLYVGNLSYDVDSSSLVDMFAQYGTVESAEIVLDRDTGRSKGFGFVQMGSDEAAQAAVAAMAGQAAPSAERIVEVTLGTRAGPRPPERATEAAVRSATHVLQLAVELCRGDRRAAEQWLRTPVPALGGRRPVDLGSTEPGAREVEDLIARIRHGVIS